MPELPEVEGVVRSLQPVVTGKTIHHVTISKIIKQAKEQGKECIIKAVDPDSFQQAIEGMTIKSIERRSKYIFSSGERRESIFARQPFRDDGRMVPCIAT